MTDDPDANPDGGLSSRVGLDSPPRGSQLPSVRQLRQLGLTGSILCGAAQIAPFRGATGLLTQRSDLSPQQLSHSVDHQLDDLKAFMAETLCWLNRPRAAPSFSLLLGSLQIQLMRDLIASLKELRKAGDPLPKRCLIDAESACDPLHFVR